LTGSEEKSETKGMNAMKPYEFEHVRMKHGIKGDVSKSHWEEKLMGILTEMGEKGWDLNGAYSETMSFHTHLIFSRERG
jgi:hypothetical protein